MIVCNTKSTMAWVERLVGVTFMQKFALKKGKTSCLILVLSLVTLLSIEVLSMQYLIYQDLSECTKLTETIKILMESDKTDPEKINKLFQKKT